MEEELTNCFVGMRYPFMDYSYSVLPVVPGRYATIIDRKLIGVSEGKLHYSWRIQIDGAHPGVEVWVPGNLIDRTVDTSRR
jgi:hypothetical protein